MKHPELLRMASAKAGVPLLMLMYDAFCFEEMPVSRRILWGHYQAYIHAGECPEVFEDYALAVLAGRAVRIPVPTITIGKSRR